MSELLLINPGRSLKARKARKKRNTVKGYYPNPGRKKKRSAAQKAATRRMLAARKAGQSKRKHNTIRTAPVAKKRKRKSRSIARVTARARVRRKHNPIRARHRRRYKPNPMRLGSMASFTRHTLMPSVVGAAGALGVDVILGFLPIPVQFKTGPMRSIVKIAGAVGIGMLASNFMKRETAHQIAAGAITVTLYDVMKDYLRQAMPTLPLSEADVMYEEYPNLSYAGAGQTVDGMGQYVSGMSTEDGVGMYVGDSDTDSSDFS